MQHSARGYAYVSCEWILLVIEIFAVTIRLYTRTFLTRSIGSDDFAILIAFVGRPSQLIFVGNEANINLKGLGYVRSNFRSSSLLQRLVTA